MLSFLRNVAVILLPYICSDLFVYVYITYLLHGAESFFKS